MHGTLLIINFIGRDDITSTSEAPVTLSGQTDNKTLAIIVGVIGAVAVMILLTVIVVLIITYARKSCFQRDENVYDLPDYYARPQPTPIEDMPSRLQTKENVAYDCIEFDRMEDNSAYNVFKLFVCCVKYYNFGR